MKRQNIFQRIGIVFIFLLSNLNAFAFEEGIRIAWDYQTAKQVNNGVYARIHPIHNNQFSLVYSDGPDVWIRRSSDQCKTWDTRVLVHHEDGYNNTNAELVTLANGWLVYAWNGRPMTENSVPYIIKTKISKDNGNTWIEERLIYSADNTFQNGCWEPSLLQLPTGEIQLYFANENPYRNNADQEISMYRSFDNGLTWSDYTTVSYRAGHRDGMPVPVYLQNNKGIAYCIEDNGLNGDFKPSIVTSSTADNWKQGAALWNSNRRWGALRSDYALGSAVYAGAPYLIQLPSGETVLSTQSSEGRINGNDAFTEVYIGTDEAKDFSRKSTPFPWIPATGNALWNAMAVLNDSTIILVSSLNTAGAGPGGIWTIQGRIIKSMNAPKASIVVDGISNEATWNAASSIFIGSQSASNLSTKISYDDQNLYVLCDVKDQQLWADSPTVAWDDDGVEIYLDPQNKSCKGLCSGMYKFLFNIGGGTLFSKVNASNVWENITPQNISVSYKLNGLLNNNSGTDIGYVMEIAIPWNQIGGKPQPTNGWGIHLKMHDDDTGGAAEFHEDLSGDDPNNAATFFKASLDFGGSGIGLSAFYYEGQNFETFKVCRTDARIDFNWGNGSPDPKIPVDNFSAQWKGNINVPVSGEYTFYITSDNGRRLMIDNKLVIDKWVSDWDIEYSGKITLQAGVNYPIELDYFEEKGGANIIFEWSHALIPKSIVPADYLYKNICGCSEGSATIDTDNDGIADCIDPDQDNDGVLNADDCAPLDKNIKGKTIWYADTDGDGFGDPAVTQLACTKPAGYVTDKTDACPTDPNKKVAGNCGCNKAEGSCLDCAGVANGTATLDACLTCVGGTTGKVTLDTDKDGIADCIDPDQDNDGVLNANDCAPLDKNIKGKTIWYADTDGDGFGDPAVTQLACTKPAGYVADKTDACPTDPNKKIAGNCGCNKVENSCLDCAGVANGTATLNACLTCVGGTTGKVTLDTDKDGIADCIDPDQDNDGVLNADDCAPLDKNIKGKTIWYADTDGDGFGDPAVTQLACTKPAGYVADKTDACPTDPNKKAAGNCGCNKVENSCLDCAGVVNGSAVLDNCKTCVGGTTGKEACTTDCAGVPGGTAYLDNCQTCVAGTTSKEACTKDCHGDFGGTASLDVCNICSGGRTGITPKTSIAACTATSIVSSKIANINVYPNPFTDAVHIDGIEAGLIEIYDASGKRIYQQNVGGDAHISLSEYASGMYLLKFSNDELQYQKVLIKK